MIWNAPRRELSALLLIAIILACHGAYGINHHHIVETAVPSIAVEAEPDYNSTSSSEEHASDTAYFTYFMALFALLATLFPLVARKYSLPLRDIERAPSRMSGIQRPLLQLPPRPSSPVLQIFRL